jgi:hypothetical protein
MMTALLSKSIRDADGRLHKRDEALTIVSRLPRADFDFRPLLKVRFPGRLNWGCVCGRGRALLRGLVAWQLGRFDSEFCHITRGLKDEAEVHFREFLDV